LVVYLGEAHTFAALIQGERLKSAKLFSHLTRFRGGELTNTEVLAEQGHACAYAPGYSPGPQFSFTIITGPRRCLAHGWPGVISAALFGDMTFTGCSGKIIAFLKVGATNE
jgi:uncharacterized protein (DUF1786 family)